VSLIADFERERQVSSVGFREDRMKELYKRTAIMFFCLRVLISSYYVFADVSQRRTFFDSFEDGLGAWQITSSVPNTVEVATDKVHSGTKSVKFNYQDGSDNKYLEALHSFPSQTNIVLRGMVL
jgi:hypothetical protein